MGVVKYLSYICTKLLTIVLPVSDTLLSIKTRYCFARVYNLPTIMKIFKKNVYKQDRQCKYKRNVEERSRNHCRVGKDISVTYIEYVSVA